MTESSGESIHPHETRRRGSVGFALGVVLALLVLYVLSPVPIMWLDHSPFLKGGIADYLPEAVIEIYFAPLVWLYENVPVFKGFYDFLYKLTGP